jgi:hypothetical protein
MDGKDFARSRKFDIVAIRVGSKISNNMHVVADLMAKNPGAVVLPIRRMQAAIMASGGTDYWIRLVDAPKLLNEKDDGSLELA